MASGFSAGGSDFYGFNMIGSGRSMAINNSKAQYGPQVPGMMLDPSSQIVYGRPDLIGKRSISEFQQKQDMGSLPRSVKPRTFQYTSPISPLSPIDVSPEISSISQRSIGTQSIKQGLQPTGVASGGPDGQPERNTMSNRLQELEKMLLADVDGDKTDGVSVITNEWADTIESLLSPNEKPISTSPTSSSTSCSSSSSSPSIACAKQSLVEAATAISEGKKELAAEILTRLHNLSNVHGSSEQRLTAYMVHALRSRLENKSLVTELYGEEHMKGTQLLYDASPCFKLGFMAANLAILDTLTTHQSSKRKLNILDFEIRHTGQYEHLIHSLSARRSGVTPTSLKITTVAQRAGDEDRLKAIGECLRKLADGVGISLTLSILSQKTFELTRHALGIDSDDILAVNFSFRLSQIPDESVTTENPRDELLRRVKQLSPVVMTLVEQELNTNTKPFVARAGEVWGYYSPLFDALDATMPRDASDRFKMEECLGRKIRNSVACEDWERVERCEVFGKWRARLSMAGFELKPPSQHTGDAMRGPLNSLPRGTLGFTVTEENGAICFGWMGRTLTVTSAWR